MCPVFHKHLCPPWRARRKPDWSKTSRCSLVVAYLAQHLLWNKIQKMQTSRVQIRRNWLRSAWVSRKVRSSPRRLWKIPNRQHQSSRDNRRAPVGPGQVAISQAQEGRGSSWIRWWRVKVSSSTSFRALQALQMDLWMQGFQERPVSTRVR